jgi:hypothetical protein
LRDFYIDERGLNVFLKTVVRSAENVDKSLAFVDDERTYSAPKGLDKYSTRENNQIMERSRYDAHLATNSPPA